MIGVEVRNPRMVDTVRGLVPGDGLWINDQTPLLKFRFAYMRDDVAIAVCDEPDDDAAWFPRWRLGRVIEV